MSILERIVGILWKAIIKVVPEEAIYEVLQRVIENWVKKHLTPEEILSEGNDLIKLIKSKL